MKPFAILILLFAAAHSKPLKKNDMFSLSKQKYAFDVSENIKLCSNLELPLRRVPEVTDYTTTINAALEAVSYAKSGTVVLEAGEYPHSGPIKIPSNVCLRGAGIHRTTLVLMKNATTARGGIEVVGATRVTVSDLTQDGRRILQTVSRDGVHIRDSQAVYLRDVRVRNNAGVGVRAESDGGPWTEKVVLEGVHSESNVNGVLLYFARSVSVLRSAALGNDRHGFYALDGTSLALFRRSTAVGNGLRLAGQTGLPGLTDERGDGFRFDDTRARRGAVHSLAVENCTALNNLHAPVRVSGAYNVYISGSRFRGRMLKEETEETTLCVTTSRGADVHGNGNVCGTNAFRSTRAPMCASGKVMGRACCAPHCMQCGGRNCAIWENANVLKSANPLKQCCFGSIIDQNVMCASSSPPCIM